MIVDFVEQLTLNFGHLFCPSTTEMGAAIGASLLHRAATSETTDCNGRHAQGQSNVTAL